MEKKIYPILKKLSASKKVIIISFGKLFDERTITFFKECQNQNFNFVRPFFQKTTQELLKKHQNNTNTIAYNYKLNSEFKKFTGVSSKFVLISSYELFDAIRGTPEIKKQIGKSKALVFTSSADIQNEECNVKFVKKLRTLEQKPNKVMVNCLDPLFSFWADFCAYFQVELTIFDLVNKKVTNYNLGDQNNSIQLNEKKDKNFTGIKVTGTVFGIQDYFCYTPSAQLFEYAIDIKSIFDDKKLRFQIFTESNEDGDVEIINNDTLFDPPKPGFTARLKGFFSAYKVPRGKIGLKIFDINDIEHLFIFENNILYKNSAFISCQTFGSNLTFVAYDEDKSIVANINPDSVNRTNAFVELEFRKSDDLKKIYFEKENKKFSAVNLPRIKEKKHISSKFLQENKEKYKGKVGWIIGNGPSVRSDDLDLIFKTNNLSFGFNKFYLAHENTLLRPDFTFTGDDQMIEDFGEEIIRKSSGEVFVVASKNPNLSGNFHWVRQIGNIYPPIFSEQPQYWVSSGGSSVFMALQVGAYLGVNKWYFYGTDFTFNFSTENKADKFKRASGDNNHFIKNYRGGKNWCPPAIDNILSGFWVAKLYFEYHGGFHKKCYKGWVTRNF